MHLRHLGIRDLRLIESLDLDLVPGWNLFIGPNGAGKTSLLEAAFLLSHGRSFRSASRDALSRRGSGGWSVFGEFETASGNLTRAGIARAAGRLEARLDREAVPVGDLMRRTAVLCFEPGSHELIAGAAEERRRFLDWGVFHVEHSFLEHWRRYQRALRQRNALLRSAHVPPEALHAWDLELASAAEPLTVTRRAYFRALHDHLLQACVHLVPELGTPRVQYAAGYDDDVGLEAILAVNHDRDRARGHTTAGPHRADWTIAFEHAPRREYLSRGQQKLCAFACTIAQARLFAAASGDWPVIGIDDLAAEVDQSHQDRMLALLQGCDAQVLITGTERSPALALSEHATAMFHVEHGRVTRLL